MPWVRWPWVPHARCRRPQLRSHARRSPRLPQVRRRPRGNQRSRWPQLPQARHPWGKSNSPSAADSSPPTAADSSPLAAAHSSPMAAAHSSPEHGPVDPSLAQGGLPVPVGCPVLVLSPRGLLILPSCPMNFSWGGGGGVEWPGRVDRGPYPVFLCVSWGASRAPTGGTVMTPLLSLCSSWWWVWGEHSGFSWSPWSSPQFWAC